MKKILVAVSAAVLLVAANTVMAADLKIAILNVQQVLRSSPQITQLQSKLKKQFAPKQEKIMAQQKKLQADITKMQRDNAVMKKSEKDALHKKILAEQKELQNLQVNFRTEVLNEQNKAMQSILKSVEDVVNSIAKKDHYNLILTKASAAYNDPAMDITDQVIKKLK